MEEAEVPEPVRKNGFERPLHPLQVLSWIVFGLDVVIFSAFQLPLIASAAAQVGVAVCFGSSVAVLVASTVIATLSDPSDPHLRLRNLAEQEVLPFCSLCDVPVFDRSKHCRVCNKCVNVFDHHCMWLNNCIGKANYRAFSVVISSVAVMIGIVLGTCSYLLMDYHVHEEDFEERLLLLVTYQNVSKEFALGLLIIMTLMNLPLFILDMQLVVLHAFLSSQYLTTYEYITRKRSQIQNELDEAGSAEDQPSASTHKPVQRRVRTLPSCMDWIVFARCGRGRRRKKKPPNAIEPIEQESATFPSDMTATEAGPEDGHSPAAASAAPLAVAAVEAAAAAAAVGDHGERQRTPSPPGSYGDDEVVFGGDDVARSGVAEASAASAALGSATAAGSSATCDGGSAARRGGDSSGTVAVGANAGAGAAAPASAGAAVGAASGSAGSSQEMSSPLSDAVAKLGCGGGSCDAAPAGAPRPAPAPPAKV